jgi:hypothetical protein
MTVESSMDGRLKTLKKRRMRVREMRGRKREKVCEALL